MPTKPISSDTLAQAGAQGVAAMASAGRYNVSPAVMSAIRDAASKTGTQFDTLLASAAIESGLNPKAKAASSSATGLFQFVDQTWLAALKRSGGDHGLAAQAASIVRRNGQWTVDDPASRQEILDLRKDPTISAAMAGDHLRDLSSQLTQSLGHAPDVSETYMGHFLGAGGATQMLKALASTPNAPASQILPDAARANPGMFSGQTVAQFVNKVRARVGQAYTDLGLPMPQGAVQFASAGSGRTPQGAAATAAADPDGTGSDGWGAGAPARMSTAPERMMLSSLTQVFTKLDKGLTGRDQQPSQRNGQMASGVVGSLDTTEGATTTYTTGI